LHRPDFPEVCARASRWVPEAGLSKVSCVICEQVRTVSTERLTKSTGMASPVTMNAVEMIVRMLLGL
jgi:mRNA-degrading endonuclease toxin of MazEF toxin-antitoxin module